MNSLKPSAARTVYSGSPSSGPCCADFRPDSDVDVLVVFESGKEPGFLRLSAMERELSDIFGRHVDLRTPEDLSRLFREEVVASSKVLYAA
jgi:uncharacterized protein